MLPLTSWCRTDSQITAILGIITIASLAHEARGTQRTHFFEPGKAALDYGHVIPDQRDQGNLRDLQTARPAGHTRSLLSSLEQPSPDLITSATPRDPQLESNPIASTTPGGPQLKSNPIESATPGDPQLELNSIASAITGDPQLKSNPTASATPGDPQLEPNPIASATTGDTELKSDPIAETTPGDPQLKSNPIASATPGVLQKESKAATAEMAASPSLSKWEVWMGPELDPYHGASTEWLSPGLRAVVRQAQEQGSSAEYLQGLITGMAIGGDELLWREVTKANSWPVGGAEDPWGTAGTRLDSILARADLRMGGAGFSASGMVVLPTGAPPSGTDGMGSTAASVGHRGTDGMESTASVVPGPSGMGLRGTYRDGAERPNTAVINFCVGKAFGQYVDPAEPRCYFTCPGPLALLGGTGGRDCCGIGLCFGSLGILFQWGFCFPSTVRACTHSLSPLPPSIDRENVDCKSHIYISFLYYFVCFSRIKEYEGIRRSIKHSPL